MSECGDAVVFKDVLFSSFIMTACGFGDSQSPNRYCFGGPHRVAWRAKFDERPIVRHSDIVLHRLIARRADNERVTASFNISELKSVIARERFLKCHAGLYELDPDWRRLS